MDAVICDVNVINPTCPKSRRYDAFRIGYTAGTTDCIMSFRKWQKLIAASTLNAAPAVRSRMAPDNELVCVDTSL